MPAIELLIPFFVASSIFACVPGPGLLYAAARTMAQGRSAGWQAGVGYLIWLGYRMFIAKDMLVGADLAVDRSAPRRALSQSVLVELLNPKTALFFLAFVPQFTDLTAAFPIWLQILVLLTIVNVMLSLSDIGCALLSDRAMRLLAASRAAKQLAHRVGWWNPGRSRGQSCRISAMMP